MTDGMFKKLSMKGGEREIKVFLLTDLIVVATPFLSGSTSYQYRFKKIFLLHETWVFDVGDASMYCFSSYSFVLTSHASSSQCIADCITSCDIYTLLRLA